jgi:hypothetical protein
MGFEPRDTESGFLYETKKHVDFKAALTVILLYINKIKLFINKEGINQWRTG